MSRFMLLLHFTPGYGADMTPEEMQRVIDRYQAWSQGLARGKLLGVEKLTRDGGGRHLRVQASKIVATDGPFSEAKEVVGGFYMIEAGDYNEAEAIARTCPHLAGRHWIEIRRVDELS